MSELREQIAKAIDPTLGIENSWAAESADRILTILSHPPEVSGDGLLPCPFCGSTMTEANGGLFHPDEDEDCLLSGLSWSADYYRTAWNTRAPSSLGSMSVEQICAVIDAVKSPYDHHTHTGEDCAFGDALEAAQQAVRAALAQAPRPMNEGEVTDE